VAQAATGHDVNALVFLGQGGGAFLAAVTAIAAASALRPFLVPAPAAGLAPALAEESAAPSGVASSYARTAAYAFLVYGVVALGTSAQSFLYAQF
jgi:hypothetical protein